MPQFFTRAALAAVVLAAPAQAQLADLAVKFGAREAFDGVALSPDGSKISYINPVGANASALVVVDTKTGVLKPIMSSGDPGQRLARCDWIKVDRIACLIVAERRDIGDDFSMSRVFAVDPDGGNVKELGARQTSAAIGINAFGGRIIDYLPDHPDDIMMMVYKLPVEGVARTRAEADGGLAVTIVNSRTGRSRVIEGPFDSAGGYTTDRRGNVRIRNLVERQDTANYFSYAKGAARWFYRAKGEVNWRPLGITDMRANNSLEVWGFDESGDNILVMKPKDGRQTLFAFSTDGSARETLLFQHPAVDVTSVKRIGKYARPVGAAYSTDYNHVTYFDAPLAKITAALARVLPGKPEISVIDETWDGNKLLIFAGSDIDPGAYYIFDKTSKSLGKLSDARPALAGMKLGDMRPVSYPAKDGTKIPGYLTLPPGKEAKGLPVIIMPHGGPSSRDVWGFDWLSQHFAQLGYAVLQPNYRGSAGYGDDWFRENGFKAWRTSIGDINDGARWLVSQGIGDPAKLAIFGWSYGGYAALQANVAEPDLYKATIAVAPVTDLAALKEDSRYGSYLIVKDFIGAGPHIVEGSPARNAKAIKTPVLMFHGTRDLNVDIRQSRMMESALKDARKPVELVVYPDLQHSLVDSGARADMLLRSSKFLRDNLK